MMILTEEKAVQDMEYKQIIIIAHKTKSKMI